MKTIAKMPKSAPILEASDMIYGEHVGGGADNPHCLQGWRNVFLFGDGHAPIGITNVESSESAKAVDDAIRLAAVALGSPNLSVESCSIVHVHQVNDRNYNPALLARVWNVAVALLGYVKGNPEAKTIAKEFLRIDGRYVPRVVVASIVAKLPNVKAA